jgi:hypothetical protein
LNISIFNPFVFSGVDFMVNSPIVIVSPIPANNALTHNAAAMIALNIFFLLPCICGYVSQINLCERRQIDFFKLSRMYNAPNKTVHKGGQNDDYGATFFLRSGSEADGLRFSLFRLC